MADKFEDFINSEEAAIESATNEYSVLPEGALVPKKRISPKRKYKQKVYTSPMRPTAETFFSIEEANFIIGGFLEGKSYKEIGSEMGIEVKNLWTKVHRDPELTDAIDRARTESSLFLIDMAMDVAKDRSNDFYTDSDGNSKPNAVAVQRDKLLVSQLNKMAGIRNRNYRDGSNVDVTSNGESMIFGGLSITPPKADEDDLIDI